MRSVLHVCILFVLVGTLLLGNIEASPVIGLSSGTASVGSVISINGSGFLPTDTACSFSSPSSAALVTSAACVTQGGSISGGFTVGNVPPGAYVIQVSGNDGDFAQEILQVSGGAQIGLSPGTGAAGVDIAISGSGFLPTDTTCSISSPSSASLILAGTVACVIQVGSGTPHGSFIIGNVLPGQYVVQINGNRGDSAQAILSVD